VALLYAFKREANIYEGQLDSMYIRFHVALSERRRQSFGGGGAGTQWVWAVTAISAGDAMMRETRSLNPHPTPHPLSLVVVHVIPWIQSGGGEWMEGVVLSP